MTDTTLNVRIDRNQWVDVLTLAGFTVGTRLDIQNVGDANVTYAFSTTTPVLAPSNPRFRVLKHAETLITERGQPTLWAYVQSRDGLLNIRRAERDAQVDTTVFGSLLAESLVPISQISARYGVTQDIFVRTDGTGTLTNPNSTFVIDTGTTPGGQVFLRTQRGAVSRPGQGIQAKVTAAFSPSVPNTIQAIGAFNPENGYFFASVGAGFGIARANNGVVEYQILTVTVAGTGSATVTIDGTAYNVTLTTATVESNAYQIASQLSAQIPTYTFNITSNGAEVHVASRLAGPLGTFAFSSATVTASWAQINAGVALDITYIPQASWNINTCDWLDWEKGNTFIIQINHGYSAARFFVEEPISGRPILVHIMQHANLGVLPNVSSPEFWTGWVVQNFAATTAVSIQGVTAASFIEGRKIIDQNRRALEAQATVDTTLTSVLVIRNRSHFGPGINFIELFPLLLSAAAQSNKTVFFELLINPDFTGDVIYNYYDEPNSIVEYSMSNVSVVNGTSFGALTVSTEGELQFNTKEINDEFIKPTDVLVIAARQSAASVAADVQVSFNWLEDY